MSRVTPNLDRWMAVYEPALAAAVAKYPAEYGFMADAVPAVAGKMRAAFAAGTYNHDGRAMKATCKALGIPYTRKAIEAFLTS